MLVVAALLVRRVVADDRTASRAGWLLDVAQSQAAAVDAEIVGTIRALESLAQSPRLDTDDFEAFNTQAQRVQQSQASWLTVILLSPDGAQLLNTARPPGAPLPSAADPDSVQRVLATSRPVVGTLRPGPEHRLGVPVRVPVVRDGAIRFVLTAVITPTASAR